MIWGRPIPNTRASQHESMHLERISKFFSRNSNSMEISCCSHTRFGEVIVMKFCAWHDSCAKFCSHMIPYNEVTLKIRDVKIKFPSMGKSFMNWAPGVRLNIKMSSYR